MGQGSVQGICLRWAAQAPGTNDGLPLFSPADRGRALTGRACTPGDLNAGGAGQPGPRRAAAASRTCVPRRQQRLRHYPRTPVSGVPVVLGAGLLVGGALALPVGLAEGVAVGAAEWLGRPGEGRGVGVALAGGLVGAAGVREAGDSRSVALARGRRVVPLFRSRTLPLAGCVAGRSGKRDTPGDAVTATSGSSGDAWSGLTAARGSPTDCGGSSDAAARPPSMAKVAAARVRPPYFFSRGGHRRWAAGTSAEGAGDQETS
ncbi:hypothetical protein FBY35_4170 [Streptomyces sp. SLBN-118]|nr:hypothetical protein FBY35_4170 [Streptomyces sp. SLBN-118]